MHSVYHHLSCPKRRFSCHHILVTGTCGRQPVVKLLVHHVWAALQVQCMPGYHLHSQQEMTLTLIFNLYIMPCRAPAGASCT